MRIRFLATSLLAASVAVHVGCEPAPSTSNAPTVNAPPAPPAPPPPPGASEPTTRSPTAAEMAAQIDPGLAGDVAMAAVPLPAKAFLSASAALNKTLGQITDGPSANAAAPQIRSQALQIKTHFPAFKLFMATAPKEQVELVFRQQAADQMAAATRQVDLLELAKQPGNEAFREAYISYLVVLRDDGTSGTRRGAERELGKLQQ